MQKTETRTLPGLHMGRVADLAILDLCMLGVRVVAEVAGDSNIRWVDEVGTRRSLVTLVPLAALVVEVPNSDLLADS